MSWGTSVWGGIPWGGCPAAEVEAPVTPTTGIGVQIAGVDYTGYLRVPTTSVIIEDSIDSRKTCEFSLLNMDGSMNTVALAIGATVRILLNSTTILFAGTVDEIEHRELADNAGCTVYQVRCVDYTQICDRHVVAARYAQTDDVTYTLRDVVQDIVSVSSGDTGETLADDGIVASNSTVQQGPLLGTVAFDYVTATEAFDDMADLTGFAWYVDFNKRIVFFDPRTYIAPTDLDPALWQRYRNLRVERGRNQYRNLQFLRAGTALTSTRTEEFAGDGKERSWKLAMPCGDKPAIYVDTGTGYVEVDEADVGVRTDEESQSGIKWFYKLGDESISQASTESILNSDDYVKVEYSGQYPILMQGRSDSEIDTRKEAEGGTGVYAHVENDEKIDDGGMARERLVSLLRKFARLEERVVFETDMGGFASGQLLTVNVPELNISGQYLIDRVKIAYYGEIETGDFIVYEVSAIKGESRGGYASYYDRLAKMGRPLTIADNEMLHLLRSRRSGIIVGDIVSVVDALREWDDDDGAHGVIGMCAIGGRRKDDAYSTEDNFDGTVYGPLIGLPYLP